MFFWTNEEISKILIQLDERMLPFKDFSLCQQDGTLKLLGRGGSAEVYEAKHRRTFMWEYAIKVIGFKKQNCDSDLFEDSVKAQMSISEIKNNIVYIYDYTELWVILDDNDNVISAVKEKPDELSGRTIKLQFIVMKKVTSIIERTKCGNIKMFPEKLAMGDEQEVLKLAYDIGSALKKAHKENILHRDVKLENIFYSKEEDKYKLGDFGIAKKTEDGFAGTVAFTKGYAAPEVRGIEEKYDNTADIYSFGITLYLLMNKLKFPGSNTYNVNSYVQYTPGYVVPSPEGNISEEFYRIILKACMYDPNQRYQSMEEMIGDIEKLVYGSSIAYKLEHKDESLAVGTIMLAAAVVLWKLTLVPEKMITFSVWQYVFWIVCLSKGLLKTFKRPLILLNIITFGVGVYLLASLGFGWAKLLFVLYITFSSGALSVYISGGVLLANITSLIQYVSEIENSVYREYSWLAVAAISIAIMLLLHYCILRTSDRENTKEFYEKYSYWKLICILYFMVLVIGCFMLNSGVERMYRSILGNNIADVLYSINLRLVGICGVVFCLFWIIREQIIVWYQNYTEQKYDIEN